MPAPFESFPSDSPPTNYQSGQITVGASATLIGTFEGATGISIANGAAIVYLGGPTVTVSTGFPVQATTTITIPAYGGAECSLYAISATSSVVSFLHPTA